MANYGYNRNEGVANDAYRKRERGLSDARVVADRDVGRLASADHDAQRRWGTHQTVHRLSDKKVSADRYVCLLRGAARVRRDRHPARPIHAQPSAIHRSWGTRWITDSLHRTRRPSCDRDNQRPRVLGAHGLATTIRDQQQQADY
jgi:hypothetical protein